MDSARGTACSLHAGELVQAQSGRRMGIRTKISGRDIVSDTGLAVERLLVGSITVGRPDEVITSERLSALYQANVEVLSDSRGRLFVVGLEEEVSHPHA